jgi:hypothetical protein
VSRSRAIEVRFVEAVPKDREDGVLYISIAHGTMVHNCACGCGSKVATPVGPARWRFTYDGESVSVCPSIGNWSYPCRSHYRIDHNRIRWASGWSEERIAAGRARDRSERKRYADAKAKGEQFVAHEDEEMPAGSRRWSLRRLFRL